MEVIKQSPKAIEKAISILNNGDAVICPTDTVYGLLADATNKKVVDKIFKIKLRPRSKPLPIFVRDLKTAKDIAEIDKKQIKTLKKFWPGKYTFIFKKKSGKKLYGTDKETVAIRIPQYKFLNDLLKKINKPLVQTSVNISGQTPLADIEDMKNKFGKSTLIDLMIDGGNLKKSKPSKIIDISGDKSSIVR